MQRLRANISDRKLRGRAVFILLFMSAHACAVIWFSDAAEFASAPFQIIAALLPVTGCIAMLRDSKPSARPGWVYLIIALVLTAFNTLVCLWVYRVEKLSYDYANISDYLYIFNYIALTSAAIWSEEESAGTWFFCFDAAQAAIAALLSYVLLFGVLPFSGQAPRPIGAHDLVRTFDIMNIALVVIALTRLIGRPSASSRYSFDRRLVLFILIFEPVMSLYNHVFGSQPGLQDLLIDIPFLVLWATFYRLPVQRHEPEQRSPIALIVDSFGPAFLTVIVVCLGVVTTHSRPILGMVAILTALILFALRGALTQSRYIRVQKALKDALGDLERLSHLDGLTGIANRRSFDLALRSNVDIAQRSHGMLALLIADVDHFKLLNDTQGHPAGDRCLIEIAALLSAVVTREADMVARYGGEEFAVLLPATDFAGARDMGRLLVAAMREREISHKTPICDFVTISVGLACFDPRGARTAEALVDAADRALYRAKQDGRNCLRWTDPAEDWSTLVQVTGGRATR